MHYRYSIKAYLLSKLEISYKQFEHLKIVINHFFLMANKEFIIGIVFVDVSLEWKLRVYKIQKFSEF